MLTEFGEPSLQLLFGRAFLLELERGNLEGARIFARAFLAHTPRIRLTVSALAA